MGVRTGRVCPLYLFISQACLIYTVEIILHTVKVENIRAAALGRKNGDEMVGEEEEGKYPTVHRGDACSGYRTCLV